MLAYVDPGLGLLAWQAVVAFFVGLLFYIRKTRTWILQFFRRILKVSKPPEGSPARVAPPADTRRR